MCVVRQVPGDVVEIKKKKRKNKKSVVGQVPGDVVEIKSGHRVPGA